MLTCRNRSSKNGGGNMKSSVVSLLEQSRYSWFNDVFQLVASNRGHRSKMTLMTSGSHFVHWLLGVTTSLTPVGATT